MTSKSGQLQNNNNEAQFNAYVASTESELTECQVLRYGVFAEEMGANLDCRRDGIDEDYFDQYCKHLYVRSTETKEVIATTRVLISDQAKLAGRYYSESEFDLKNILRLKGTFLEIGRTCVRGEYRTGAAINALWQRVAATLIESNADYLFGCYSIPMHDRGRYINSLMDFVKKEYYAPEEYRVVPTTPVKIANDVNSNLDVVMPSLLKRYLNMGAFVCGEPCFDAAFNISGQNSY